MVETRSNPRSAPDYEPHRYFKAETGALIDALPATDRRRGMNMGSYRFANVQVIPKQAGANPAVAVLYWSEAAGKFVQTLDATTKAGAGDGVSYEFTVECFGRIMFVAITGGMADAEEVEIYVSGFHIDRK